MSITGIMGGIDACETSGVGRWVGPEGARGAGCWKEGPGGVEGARGAGCWKEGPGGVEGARGADWGIQTPRICCQLLASWVGSMHVKPVVLGGVYH